MTILLSGTKKKWRGEEERDNQQKPPENLNGRKNSSKNPDDVRRDLWDGRKKVKQKIHIVVSQVNELAGCAVDREKAKCQRSNGEQFCVLPLTYLIAVVLQPFAELGKRYVAELF